MVLESFPVVDGVILMCVFLEGHLWGHTPVRGRWRQDQLQFEAGLNDAVRTRLKKQNENKPEPQKKVSD